MEGPRPPYENELPQLIHFLDRELRPEKSWSLAAEYPTVFSSTNMHNMRIITSEDEFLSHAVIKPILMKTPLAVFKVAAIGSVVTSPQHRNQGLSQKILENCLEESRRQECDLAILWSDLYEFYQKLNFELCGTEISLVLEENFPPPMPNLKILKGAQISSESVLRLFNQHTVTSVRSAEDIRKFFQIPNSSIYTAWDLSNNLVAYAVEGKGADLSGYIHEWGGSIPALLSLLSQIRREKNSPITLIAPNTATHLIRKLEALGTVTKNEGFLGLIKILNFDQVFRKVKKAARSLGVHDFVLDRNGKGYVIGVNGELLLISDEKAMCRVLFGPSIELPDISPVAAEKFKKILPLPLWVWGWDSI
jgi:hypothetical protein